MSRRETERCRKSTHLGERCSREGKYSGFCKQHKPIKRAELDYYTPEQLNLLKKGDCVRYTDSTYDFFAMIDEIYPREDIIKIISLTDLNSHINKYTVLNAYKCHITKI